MRTTVELAARAEFSVHTVYCDGDDHTSWSEPESRAEYGLVLVRRGLFRRHATGMTADLDPTVGYFSTPDAEGSF